MSKTTDKAKEWAIVIAILMSGVSGRLTWSNHTLSIEVAKKEKQLAEAEQKAEGFALAGLCE